jgi:kanamycin nucleotidyltransferase
MPTGSGGPQPMSHEARLALAREIADRALARHGAEVLALGVYGSLARGADGSYSDVEMMCVLRSPGTDHTAEWAHGPWKAEVNFLGYDVALSQAAELEGDWPLTHGAYLNILPLHDPEHFFERVRTAALAQPDDAFKARMAEVIVGEIYEVVGKLRNARHSGHIAYLPQAALSLARWGAFLIGLAHRHCYTSGPRLLEESLTLGGRPPGYDALCQLVLSGNLRDPAHVADLCEAFWSGVESWAAEHDLTIIEAQRIPF